MLPAVSPLQARHGEQKHNTRYPLQAKGAAEAKQRHAMELRRQIEAADARAAQRRAAARSEGAATRAAEAARQALVEVSHMLTPPRVQPGASTTNFFALIWKSCSAMTF